jgi:hypothetical protein
LQTGQIFCPLHKERVAHTKLCHRALEREITHLTETISLQKTELLDYSMTVADFAGIAPRRMGNDGPRHEVGKSNYERIGDGLGGKGA